MTYDPHKFDPYSNDPSRDLEENSGVTILLVGALLLGAFIYLYVAPSGQKFATNDLRPPITQQSTTGSSANMPPAPQPQLEPKVKPVE